MPKISQRQRDIEACMDFVDAATSPKVMSKAAAVEFLEELRDQLHGRIEALHDEIAEDS